MVTESGLLWGPLSEIVVGLPRIEITELMYNPEPGEAEFLELRNTETVPVDLSGTRFQGVDLTLPPGAVLPPGGYGLVTDNPGDLAKRYGANLPVIGEYGGGLSGNGELIRLLDGTGSPFGRSPLRRR